MYKNKKQTPEPKFIPKKKKLLLILDINVLVQFIMKTILPKQIMSS